MSDASVEMSTIQSVLDAFLDPEKGRSITTLEQVSEVNLAGNDLSLTLGLTTFSAPIWEETRTNLEQKLRAAAPGLGDVTINIREHHRPPIELGEIRLTSKAVIAVDQPRDGTHRNFF